MPKKIDDNLVRKTEFNRQLRITFKKLRLAAGASSATFAEMMGCPVSHYLAIESGTVDASVAEIRNISQALEINVGLLFSGQIDFPVFAAQHRGIKGMMPARYCTPREQLSRARGIFTIYEYLRHTLGEDYALDVFSSFQLLPDYFSNLHEYVNPRLGEHIMSELSFRGFSEAQLRTVGTYNYLVGSADLNTRLRQLKSPRQLYETVHEQMPKHYDRIFSYKLTKLSDTGCTIVTEPKDEPIEVFKTRAIGSREVCLFKQGVAVSFLANIRNRFAEITESQCVYTGAMQCVYHLHW